MRKILRNISVLITIMCVISIFHINALAVDDLAKIEELPYEAVRLDDFENWYETRATDRINISVEAGKQIRMATGYSLESVETVTFNLTYSPRDSSIDVGLIDPDGHFHYAKGSDGTFNVTIQVDQTGKYYVAIRNRSSQTVTVMGYIYY